MHPMELLDEVYHMESRFGLVGDRIVSVQDSCMVCAQCTIGSEILWKVLMVLLVEEAQVEGRFNLFGDSANLDAR